MLIFMPKLTKTKQDKINKLSGMGFSNGEIARTLKISDETVRKYRGGQTDDEPKSNKIVERDKKRRRVGSGDESGSGTGRADVEHTDTDTFNSGQGEGIKFIGGDKIGQPEVNDYECPCGAVFSKPYKHCPECGKELEWA